MPGPRRNGKQPFTEMPCRGGIYPSRQRFGSLHVPGRHECLPYKAPRKIHFPTKNAALLQAASDYRTFSFAGKLSSTSIKKMQPKPSASHSVKGESSTSVLMMAAVTGSAKL